MLRHNICQLCGQVSHNGNTCDALCPAYEGKYNHYAKRLKQKIHQHETLYQWCVYLAHTEG